jgi:hypothetical protein
MLVYKISLVKHIVKFMLEYNLFLGKLSRMILKQHMTYLCVAEYHQIINQQINCYSRISRPIPVATSLLKINQNKDMCQHNNNSLMPTATAAAFSTAHSYIKRQCMAFNMLRQTSPNLWPLISRNICWDDLERSTVWCRHSVFSSGGVKGCK